MKNRTNPFFRDPSSGRTLFSIALALCVVLTGTHDSLLDASNYIATIERRQGLKVACLEEIAWRQGWIDEAQVARLAQPMAQCGYGQYLMTLIDGKP